MRLCLKRIFLLGSYVLVAYFITQPIFAAPEARLERLRIQMERVPTQDSALRLAVQDLKLALRARGVEAEEAGGGPSESRRIVLEGEGQFENDRQQASQAYAIAPVGGGLKVSSSGIGLVYGVFRLAETIRREGLDWNLHLAEKPAFPERIFSYQGTIFDLPDEGYYFRDAPYVNEPLLKRQVGYAKESMRKLLRYGFNTVAFLNLNVEDYVNYDLLGDGLQVYSPDSLHRRRSAIFCRALSGLADYAHQLHMQLFIQVYELSFPDHLDGRQLSDNSEYAWRLVDAKYRELFQRTSLDGIIITATEPSPRLGYRGFILWKTPEGAGRMASHYYDTIVRKSKRRLIFRLWRVASDMEKFKRVLSAAPEPDLMYDTKETDGDFFLDVGENKLVPDGAAKLRPFSVTFDVWREFDGWGKLIFFPTYWAKTFQDSERNGVVAVDAWGPWATGCIYPGVWVGKYDAYDFWRHGFSPALPALYLFSRLAWNPDQPVYEIADDWIALHVGNENVEPVRKALFLSYDLWKTTYLTSSPGSQLAFKWAMVFLPMESFLPQFSKSVSTKALLDSNDRALALAARIHDLIYSVKPEGAPDSAAVAGLHQAADLTLLYFQTFTRWRELIWRDAQRKGLLSFANDRAKELHLCNELEKLLPEWHKYPQEAKDWLIFQFDPDLQTAPEWMPRTSVADTIRNIRDGLATDKKKASPPTGTRFGH